MSVAANSPWPTDHDRSGPDRDPGATSKPPSFSVVISRAMGTVVVFAHGVLDPDSSRVLADTLRDLIDHQGNLAVVVDLRDLAVADPVCLGVLAAAAASAGRRGGELTVADPSKAVAQALTLAGVSLRGSAAPSPVRGGDPLRERPVTPSGPRLAPGRRQPGSTTTDIAPTHQGAA